jgi:hypothetical protein
MKRCRWVVGLMCMVAAIGVADEQRGTGTNASARAAAAEPIFFTAQMFQQIQQDLRRIETAKAMWAMDGNKGPKEEPTWADVNPFLKGRPPVPPCGGVYLLNDVTTPSEVRISSRDLEQHMIGVIKAQRGKPGPNPVPEDTDRKLADPQH